MVQKILLQMDIKQMINQEEDFSVKSVINIFIILLKFVKIVLQLYQKEEKVIIAKNVLKKEIN